MCDAKDPRLNMEKVGWFCFFSSGYPGELELGFHKSIFLGGFHPISGDQLFLAKNENSKRLLYGNIYIYIYLKPN